MIQAPISIYPTNQGANRCNITTWGFPTPENTPSYPIDAHGTRNPVPPTYAAITMNDTFTPLMCAHLTDKSVEIHGNPSGAQLDIIGSNDGQVYHILKDVFGTPLTGLTLGLWQINEETKYISLQFTSTSTPSVGTGMTACLVGNAKF